MSATTNQATGPQARTTKDGRADPGGRGRLMGGARPRVMARPPSQSKAGVEYEITLGFDGALACNCPAFAFSKARPKDCKHLGIYRDGRGQSVANSGTHAPAGDTMAGLIRLTDLWTKTREPGGEQYLEGPLGPPGW